MMPSTTNTTGMMELLAYTPWVCLHPVNLIKLFKQPKLYVAACVAFPCGLIGAFLKFYETSIEADKFKGVINNASCYNSLTFLVIFILQFRIDAAYGKFWNAAHSVYHLVGDLWDGTSDLIAYTRCSKAPPEQVILFQHTIVRLASLLNAVIFAELELGADRQHSSHDGEDFRNLPAAYDYELIDVNGFEFEDLKRLAENLDKLETVYFWIQTTIVQASASGLFAVPAPIVSKVFADMGSAMSSYHLAQKITEVPFPFPFQIALQLLLATHFCVTPLVVSSWTDYAAWAFGFCFTGTFSVWFFFGIAQELDAPFLHTRNSVDLRYLQRLLNHRLLTVLDSYHSSTPSLLATARRGLGASDMKSGDVAEGLSKNLSRRSHSSSRASATATAAL